jgi:hypothetical protein
MRCATCGACTNRRIASSYSPLPALPETVQTWGIFGLDSDNL